MTLRLLSFILAGCLFACQSKQKSSVNIEGLTDAVEIVRDSAGVNHIYAKNEHDLFFAQGYAAARDRLFQFEVWRRQATGTVAELLGQRETQRDIGARLFRFRGDMSKELDHYHPRGAAIIRAFTDGINAYVREVRRDTSLLPIEFKLLQTLPGEWTPEVVISRHQGLLGNLPEEVAMGRAVALVGSDKVKSYTAFDRGNPDIQLDASINKESLLDSISALYNAFRAPLRFKPEDVTSFQGSRDDFEKLAFADQRDWNEMMAREKANIGSNNWIVSGAKSESGFPVLANDPHRAITVPSLRYMVHLNAPGWNVVGAGEPTLPGISIGHNDFGAWGLTIFALDGEDMYVYDINPDNADQYKYQGNWETMEILHDTIQVKGSAPVAVDHRYTRHGPVTFVDKARRKAYAIRCAWLEPGGAPYLASLRMDQAETWEKFREACSYSHIPGENMIWADKSGNIGWQAVGIAPIRKNWSGLVPVPGDGRFEWDGYLPIRDLPSLANPAEGYFATANEYNVPQGYAHPEAVAWQFADAYRVQRINQVLGSREKFTQQEMQALQFDYVSLPAQSLVPLLQSLTSAKANSETARKQLLAWDFNLLPESVEAGIYVAWERKILAGVLALAIPESVRKYSRYIKLSRAIEWTVNASGIFGGDRKKRDAFLISALDAAVEELKTKLGEDMGRWQYGQAAYHHSLIKHPLSNLVGESLRKKMDHGPLPRGGYGSTPGATSGATNQVAGASFRMVVDTKDWDKAMFTNTPGQSGDPRSPFYGNLFERWAKDQHFPVRFTRDRVEASAFGKETLYPPK